MPIDIPPGVKSSHLKTIEENLEEVNSLPMKPTGRKSFVGRTVEEAVDFGLGVLKDIKKFAVDETLATHWHETEDGSELEFECQDMHCDLWFWNDSEVKAVIDDYDRFREWIGRDLNKFRAVLLLKIRSELKTVTGPIAKFLGIRVRILRVAGIIIALLGSGVLGANFDTVLSLFGAFI